MRRRTFLAATLAPVLPAPRRLRTLAVGDIHGDLAVFVRILRDAGVVNSSLQWTGGATNLVQTGDIVDRGPDSRKVLELLMRLQRAAPRSGGQVHVVLGNHEAMNIYGDLRYVSPPEFASWAGPDSARLRDAFFRQRVLTIPRPPAVTNAVLRRMFEEEHPLGWLEHAHAFSAGGEVGRWLRGCPAVLRLDGTLFVHGGLSPAYAGASIESMNAAVRADLETAGPLQLSIATDVQGPLWYRGLAFGDEAPLAAHVDALLERHGVSRIVIGHTLAAPAILPRFGGKVIVIDCGISALYHALPAALLIEDGRLIALHRGHRLPIPAGPAALPAYLRAAAALDPAPSPLLRYIQGRWTVLFDGDK